jgi:hypothetical protein
VFGQAAGGFGLGLLAFLLGVGGVAAALRIRRRRERYPETYAATGGMLYTTIQIGCSGLLVLGGIGVMILAIVFRR